MGTLGLAPPHRAMRLGSRVRRAMLLHTTQPQAGRANNCNHRERGGAGMNTRASFAILLLYVVPGVSFAIGGVPLPEPGVLELLAIGAAAGIAVAIRNRRK